LSKETFERQPDLVEKLRELIKLATPKSIISTLHALAQRREMCTALKRVRVPALVICGKEDQVTPLSQAELLVNCISGAELKIIENAGHLTNLEQPQQFDEAIERFLASLKEKAAA
jgi:pimeloyl-ACP methyl ester carboxylesterase